MDLGNRAGSTFKPLTRFFFWRAGAREAVAEHVGDIVWDRKKSEKNAPGLDGNPVRQSFLLAAKPPQGAA